MSRLIVLEKELQSLISLARRNGRVDLANDLSNILKDVFEQDLRRAQIEAAVDLGDLSPGLRVQKPNASWRGSH